MSARYPYVSVTDFGQPNRVHVVSRHTSEETARRQFKRVVEIYNKLHGHRAWLMPYHGDNDGIDGDLGRFEQSKLGSPILYVGPETNDHIHDLTAPRLQERIKVVVVMDCNVADKVLDNGYFPPRVCNGGEDYVRENMPDFVASTLCMDQGDSYHLSNPTVYTSLADFDADRAEGQDHFAQQTVAP